MENTLNRMGLASGATMWHLPAEVLVLIFSFLPVEDIARASRVCSWWSQVAQDRRVWRGKNFLSNGSHGLSVAFPVARALPVLKRVSICSGISHKVYLNGESAGFKVINLCDEAVTSTISALATVNLTVDFFLLEERHRNCLVVQLHKLKHLKICASQYVLPQGTFLSKLRALSNTLSCEPLSNLQSVDIHTDESSFVDHKNMHSDILGALSTCTALERVTIRTHCVLSRGTVTEFSKLQFLQLLDCVITDISFLDLCPNLHSLWLGKCKLPMRGLPSRLSELRSLTLCHLSVTTEFVDMLCKISPKLESITLVDCSNVVHTLFLGHCPKLRFVEVNQWRLLLSRKVSLPPQLQQLKLHFLHMKSDALAEILQGVPRLEILNINGLVDSLRFLRHCPDLTDLFLSFPNTFRDFNEVGELRGLRKLCTTYNYGDIGPLGDALCKMPQLELLQVVFMKNITNLSFLRYCHRLHCLTLASCFHIDEKRLSFHELSDLKELRELSLHFRYLDVEDLVVFLPSMPHLEALDITFVNTKCNLSFLRHCGQLTSLEMTCRNVCVSHLIQLRQLRLLRRLTVTGLSDDCRCSLAEEVLRLPKLEYLSFEKNGPNLLGSWMWCQMLSQ